MISIAVVGTPGGWSSERLADAVYEKTGFRLLVDMQKISLDLPSGKMWFEDYDLTRLDGLIIKKIGARYSPDLLDRLEMLRLLNEKGLPIFSTPLNIMRVLDRLSCTITLQLAGIPMPETTVTEAAEAALCAVEAYGEAVFKPLYSTKAKGMAVIQANGNARTAIEAFHRENPIMYIQKKLDLHGKDMGLVFLGGTYLTTYARVKSKGAWNTTTRSGGTYEAYDPPPHIIELAQKAQQPFGLDFTCVDVAETDDGPVVFEVSAFGGFRGIQSARGIDAAQRYVDYVLRRVV
jgi:tetrahydromethanopterin:alpha-L-glutamate ligase